VLYLAPRPERLRDTLNQRIAATPGARTILLAYGRCSNGTAGLVAGPHRLVLPAVDDCIAILLGSRDEYLRQFSGCPGTYYYTRGWIEYIDDPYHEYLQMIPRYGEQKAREIAHLILANYRRVALVDTGTYELAACDEYLRTVCQFYDLPLEVLPGSLRLLEKLVGAPTHDDEFITVAPGDVLEERLGVRVHPTDDVHHLRGVCEQHGVTPLPEWGPGKLVFELYDQVLLPELLTPVLLVGFPVEVSPLARHTADDPTMADRFELCIVGREFANGYSELNIPEEQAERFEVSAAAKAPSTVKTAAPTVDVPPVVQGVLDQPPGRLLPENSEPAVGVRITSPSTVRET